MDEMLKMIGNLGFPIAVAAYLLVRMEQRMDSLTSAIGELREAILMMPKETASSALTSGRSGGSTPA
ncbi:MAG TPA: YvrJ family protein [Syntrophomonadaceae bacterium]|nr:YvrJ family protein [Syntrophomonadaceae bacterium]